MIYSMGLKSKREPEKRNKFITLRATINFNIKSYD